MTTERMRYGENSFHELNILEEVCSWVGVRGGGRGSKADTGGGAERGGGAEEGGGTKLPEEVGEGGGGGSSSSKHAANRASKSPLASTTAAACNGAAEAAASLDDAASTSARSRPSKLHCGYGERKRGHGSAGE
jgi:hypothetical protein